MLSDSVVYEALSRLTGSDPIYPRKLFDEDTQKNKENETKEEKLATLKFTIDITEYQNDLFPMLLEVESGVREELVKIDNNEEFIKANLKDIIMTQLKEIVDKIVDDSEASLD